MTEDKKPKASKEIKSGNKSQNTETKHGKMTKAEVEHAYKLALTRDCQIYGKLLPEAKIYFKSKGFTLGHTQFTALRNELKSSKTAKDWFSKEALYIIEEDHMISVERIRTIENKLVNELHKIIKEDKFETDIVYDKYENVVKIRNYNMELLIKLTAQFQSLQETKTKMYSATPMVQEMMEVHRRQEEESQAPPISAKREEKEIRIDAKN